MNAITALKGWFELLEGEVGEKQETRTACSQELQFKFSLFCTLFYNESPCCVVFMEISIEVNKRLIDPE